MRVQREFHDPSLARQLEQVDEVRLAAALADIEADAEIVDAIEHFKKTDTAASRPVGQFLAELQADNLI